ncbi:hypothetical protein [Actinobacillus porcinus]|uniref:hypothetical protein n=1 Tax=Actinobacillus porcinus TaxID=51048 RepID=UPI002A911615|nr:hypothetical protein [Actinobacillus porcinus]MDY6215022.1 hypothetical protein [Actinobacillus porcinus]
MKKLFFVLGLSVLLAACGEEVKTPAQSVKEDNAAVSETKAENDVKEVSAQPVASADKIAVNQEDISETKTSEQSNQQAVTTSSTKQVQPVLKTAQRNKSKNNDIGKDGLSAEERRVGVQSGSALINQNDDKCHAFELSEEERRILQCR